MSDSDEEEEEEKRGRRGRKGALQFAEMRTRLPGLSERHHIRSYSGCGQTTRTILSPSHTHTHARTYMHTPASMAYKQTSGLLRGEVTTV